MKQKLKNIQMEVMLEQLKPLLPHRDKVGYIAARNTRILGEALTEYFSFKQDLIRKYGEVDKDAAGKEIRTISVKPDSPNFSEFMDEFDKIKNVEQEVDLLTLRYEESIGILSGEEILCLDWMLEN